MAERPNTEALSRNQHELELQDSRDNVGLISSSSRDEAKMSGRWKAIFCVCGSFIGLVTILVFIFGVVIYTPPAKPVTPPEQWNQLRLPPYAKPKHYAMRIEPNFDDFTYTIQEQIDIHVSEETDTLVLHSVGHQIDSKSVTLHNAAGNVASLSGDLSFNTEFEFVYFTFSSLLEWTRAGQTNFTLSLTFSGNLTDNAYGFYRSSYVENGTLYWMATTDFEPTNARAAFVSFDEPQMKAEFTLTLVAPSEYEALSNMPVESTSPLGNGKKSVKFSKSVPMSTYLVCFIVCKFQRIESNTFPVNVRVWTTPGTIHQADYALQIAVGVLTFFEEYFGIPFPLPKLDLIAIPDYSPGAMENWGLITFRTTNLLLDPLEASSGDRQAVAATIAHEIAHQWFGNLVTAEWWNDIWLNEGFATFMEYVGTNHVEPTWEMWQQFVWSDHNYALQLDALESSHPVSVELTNPSEIAQQFDAISYSKGGSIIRMLEAYLNKKNANFFTQGLKHYLTIHSYANAKTSDLWKALSEASGESILPQIMDTWTLQTGYPYVTLSASGNQLKLSQARFLLTEEQRAKAHELWWIPIFAKTQQGLVQELSLPMQKEKVFDVDTSNGYVLVNFDGTGFYRVRYSEDMLNKISAQLQSDYQAIESSARAVLLDDNFVFAAAGIHETSVALALSQYLAHETEYVPWMVGLDGLRSIAVRLELQPFYSLYQEFVLSLIENIYNVVGWVPEPSESHSISLLRSQILGVACDFGHAHCIATAKQLFANFQNDTTLSSIPSQLRSVVYRTVIANGEWQEYEWLLNRYRTSNVASERLRCLRALAASSHPYLLQRTLELSIDTSSVRSTDSVSLIAAVASNIHGRTLAWDFFRDNFGIFQSRYSAAVFALPNLIVALTRHFETQTMLQEVQDFLAAHPIDAGSRSINNALETIRFNIHWLQTNKDNIHNWLNH